MYLNIQDLARLGFNFYVEDAKLIILSLRFKMRVKEYELIFFCRQLDESFEQVAVWVTTRRSGAPRFPRRMPTGLLRSPKRRFTAFSPAIDYLFAKPFYTKTDHINRERILRQ
jgi:hypothetical protein